MKNRGTTEVTEGQQETFYTVHVYEGSYQWYSTDDYNGGPTSLEDAIRLADKRIAQASCNPRKAKLWANILGGNMSEFGMRVDEEKCRMWIEAFETTD